MKVVRIFLIVFFLTFSQLACLQSYARAATPLDSLVSELEKSIKERAGKKEIERQARLIEEAKKRLPVNYVPELNYLLKREIEKLPRSELSSVRNIIFISGIARKSVLFVAFFISILTFVYYFQKAELPPTLKQALSVAPAAALGISFLLNIYLLFFFLVAISVVFNLRLKKWRFLILLVLLDILGMASLSLEENGKDYISSPGVLYSIKVKRDGYLPEYLIDKALENPIERKIEKATNLLAFGNLKGGEELLKLYSPRMPAEEKLIITNNLGYYYFLKGDYKTAEKYFNMAEAVKPTQEVKYNLYLTYAALLLFEKANSIIDQLERGTLEHAKEIPMLIHVSPPEWKYSLPVLELAAFALGIALGFVVNSRIIIIPALEEEYMLVIPGMFSYLDNRILRFIFLLIVIFSVNLFISRWLCSI